MSVPGGGHVRANGVTPLPGVSLRSSFGNLRPHLLPPWLVRRKENGGVCFPFVEGFSGFGAVWVRREEGTGALFPFVADDVQRKLGDRQVRYRDTFGVGLRSRIFPKEIRAGFCRTVTEDILAKGCCKWLRVWIRIVGRWKLTHCP